MGAFSRKDDLQIPRTPEEGANWGWEPHETVTIKGKLTVGDVDAVSNVSAGTDGKVNAGFSVVKQLYQMITSWNLTDEQNRVAELSLRNIEQLPMSYVTPIMEAVDEVAKRDAVKDEKSFLSSVKEPSSVS